MIKVTNRVYPNTSPRLMDLPFYIYPIGRCCPECYRPLTSLKRKDGRCESCLKNRDFLPVNFKRPVRKRDEEEETDRKNRRKYDRDDEDN